MLAALRRQDPCRSLSCVVVVQGWFRRWLMLSKAWLTSPPWCNSVDAAGGTSFKLG